MGKTFLMDANTIIDYLDGKLPLKGMAFVGNVVDDQAKLSIIAKIEVLGFNTNPTADKILTDFMNAAKILNLDDSIVNETISLRKNYRIKLPDAIMAATSLVNDLTLITRNVADFKNITGLELINPYEI
jgi:predicted nucleic acid-binding protein